MITRSTLLLLTVLALIAAACGSEGSDDGQTPDAATASPTPASTRTPVAPQSLDLLTVQPIFPSDIPAEQYDEYREAIDELVADVERYWAAWFRTESSEPWQEPTVYTAVENERALVCGDQQPDVEGSYYCTPSNYVAFAEAKQLLPLYLYAGRYAAAMVISHEFGHAVQGSLGIEHSRFSYKERQADCFAGVWFRHDQDEGGFTDLAEPFTQAVSAMRTVDEGEDLTERYDALVAGFHGGPEECLELFPEEGFRIG